MIEPNIEVLSIGNSATDEIDEELAKKIQMVINQAVKDKIKSVQVNVLSTNVDIFIWVDH